ncbi:hypothetical protein [Dermatophilus congolensis]|uniref:Uncharacterized protein n=1 Tax=Dermatophilus congolensis TaxID=1863 RepID=A0A239VQ38_9MICO|nr:hypothetical protein [Dermatophilus congolensis]MBO3129589.1 hypothetical protein [Dermatophilus congolensis]MBO3131778.1 hypothetical protein [Dermatophilus congolensis]MBO3134064.1 hypothetical protein [Dermatophilus congolensis]MBO3136297.1 hypothetical protein [Dermatophilus congolensis]MBO3138545.1 hypothetical protein [Dermatophilus congolensis]
MGRNYAADTALLEVISRLSDILTTDDRKFLIAYLRACNPPRYTSASDIIEAIQQAAGPLDDILTSYGASHEEPGSKVAHAVSQLRATISKARLTGTSWESIAKDIGLPEQEARRWFTEAHEQDPTH